MASDPQDSDNVPQEQSQPAAIQSVVDALSRIKYGAIQLTVHEGRLVQVDVTERQRFSN